MLRSAPFVNLELHDEIKRRLKAKQITLSSIADEAGYGLSMISMVSQGLRSNTTIEELIARKLGERPEVLWGRRFQLRQQAEGGKTMKHK